MAKQHPSGVSRRSFVKTAASTGAALAIVPRHVLGRGFTAPSDLLNIAAVGVGGMGKNNVVAASSQNIVALCDVDWGFAGKGFDRLAAEIKSAQDRLANPPAPRPEQTPETQAERARNAARSAVQ